MKKLFLLLCAAAMMCAAWLPTNASAGEPFDGELVITLRQFDELRYVYFVMDFATNDVCLRVQANSVVRDQDELEFLTGMVLEITTPDTPCALGDTGFVLNFEGNFPEWGPYTYMGPEGEFKCLHFASNATLCDRIITVHGGNSKPPYSWYYDERPR